jgi:hypothetical protein
MWTCCECENEYDESTGDVDERMCDECLDGDDDLTDLDFYQSTIQNLINLADRSRENKINNEVINDCIEENT